MLLQIKTSKNISVLQLKTIVHSDLFSCFIVLGTRDSNNVDSVYKYVKKYPSTNCMNKKHRLKWAFVSFFILSSALSTKK